MLACPRLGKQTCQSSVAECYCECMSVCHQRLTVLLQSLEGLNGDRHRCQAECSETVSGQVGEGQGGAGGRRGGGCHDLAEEDLSCVGIYTHGTL